MGRRSRQVDRGVSLKRCNPATVGCAGLRPTPLTFRIPYRPPWSGTQIPRTELKKLERLLDVLLDFGFEVEAAWWAWWAALAAG